MAIYDPKLIGGCNPFEENPFPNPTDAGMNQSPVPGPPVIGEHHEPIVSYGVQMAEDIGDVGVGS